MLFREALIEAAADVAAGTVPLSFASELRVRRNDRKVGPYYEVLSMEPGDCNLGFLNRDGDLCCDHDEKQVIGKIVPGSARVCADKKTRCKANVTDPTWLERVKDGWRGGVSVGYVRKKIVRQEVADDGLPVFHYEWAAYEVSFLNVEPADNTVGLFRNKSMKNQTLETLLEAALSGSRQTENNLTREALRDYSLMSVLQRGEQGARVPFEKSFEYDVHTECCRSFPGGRNAVNGCLIPFGALLPQTRGARDMQASIFGAGGAAVPSDMNPAIELLYNRVVVIPLGAQVITGLTGDYLAPRETSALAPGMVSEIGAAAQSQITLDQPALKPRRATVQIPISTQLLMQTGGAAEQIIRRSIRKALGVLVDKLSLFGQGAGNEPCGILNTPGIGTVTFGGAATWPNVLLFEENLSLENADGESMGWAISPTTRNKWKQASRIAATNFPSFIMEDGKVNAYPALTSNSLAGQNQAIFGNWPDFYILIWGDGAVDVTFDKITHANQGECILTAHLYLNFLATHPQAFCASADSAAQ